MKIVFSAAALNVLSDADMLPAAWGGTVDNLLFLILGASGALGLLMQNLSRRLQPPVGNHHRAWTRVLLALMLLCAIADYVQSGLFVRLLPDYGVLRSR